MTVTTCLADAPLLSIRQLSITAGKKVLLDIPQLSARGGEFIGLLGANGAGKSTLFKSITGEMKGQGELFFHDRPVSSWPARELARHLAVLPQASQLNFPFIAEEVVAMGLIPLSAGASESRRLIHDAMQQTDTLQFSDQLYTQLSGGERQRVHLARTLVQLSQAEQAPLFLLDEPTSAQDLGQQHQILALLQSLCRTQGWTVIAILHDLNQALGYCDQVWLLNRGELVDTGAPEQVITPQQVAQVWGYQSEIVCAGERQVLI
ncbi:heme ABC transporter ATP-binding protein [Aestuariirhabdus sp. Z084]|uniref:heme ABC transporter ATP-binding protein n=1 Tax=Aestuariirhabdus haliotis TaxID=2918751 RepID=UPI00201B38A6|nr:heme ABC transporter ATP-binding protein [Aestuariirhabdus haliotis]MCL6417476.1 heme ABC transporter ATP-binding protein [Aestuariirhabdus haliotis]MCL6421405.1 heme ABC transporter ATP-binding protein [Aestuariirhabdus haliotis]